MPLFLPLLLSASLPLAGANPVELREREKVADLWTLTNAKQNPPFYPADNLLERKMGCVAVGFQIEADGSTSDVQVLRVVANDVDEKQARRFGDATKVWAEKLQYAAVGRPRPVFTYEITTFTLNSSEGSAKTTEEMSASLEQRCVIEDFPATMHKLFES